MNSCPVCRYDLSGSADDCCSECGSVPAAVRSIQEERRELRAIWLLIFLGVWIAGLAVFSIPSYAVLSISVYACGGWAVGHTLAVAIYGVAALLVTVAVSVAIFNQ